eukprot:1276235-Rhodomonas_salina.1
MSGTDLAYDTTQPCGTALAYGATRPCVTDLAYGATQPVTPDTLAEQDLKVRIKSNPPPLQYNVCQGPRCLYLISPCAGTDIPTPSLAL